MKSKVLLSAVALAAAVSLQGVAQGAEVSTDPVGVVKVDAKANSDVSLGLPLQRSVAMQAPVVSVSANTITVGATLTANQFVYTSPAQTNHYYVRVKSASGVSNTVLGAWFTVLANTATSGSPGTATITVDPGSSQTLSQRGLLAGDVIEVVPFWTLSSLFPNGQGITVTTNIDSPRDTVSFLPQERVGVNHPVSQVNFYNVAADLPAGWYNLGTFENSGDQPIPPDSFVIIRNKGTQKPIALTGRVPMSPQSTVIGLLSSGVVQDNLACNPFPVPISLAQTNLVQSGAFKVTTNIDSPQDLVMAYSGTESGVNARPSLTFFYSTDPQLGTGWFNLGTLAGPLDNDKVLLPGYGFIIRTKPGGAQSAVWTMPEPY